MEKGLSKYWTPGQEIMFEERIKRCQSFAERYITMGLRDLLKYDGRSKEGKRAIAQSRLRLATATDEDLEELAKLGITVKVAGEPGQIPGLSEFFGKQKKLEELKKLRDSIKAKGISKEELRCQ